MAVAGIARPERFFGTVREQGWTVVKEVVVRDHHWFSRRELDALVADAQAAGADVILTTEKDAVRLMDLLPEPAATASAGSRPPVAFVPITAIVEPAAAFGSWLRERLRGARLSRDREVA